MSCHFKDEVTLENYIAAVLSKSSLMDKVASIGLLVDDGLGEGCTSPFLHVLKR